MENFIFCAVMKEKIEQWITELRMLCVLLQDLIMWTIANISNRHQQYQVALTVQISKENWISFPPKLGGLGIQIFLEINDRECKFLRMI